MSTMLLVLHSFPHENINIEKGHFNLQKTELQKSFKTSQMQEDKDFRSHYYERVGFRGVDERKMLDSLLREDPVSLNRCAAFALKCTVPSDRRRALWEAVLGDKTF